jgi:hypothetical protein
VRSGQGAKLLLLLLILRCLSGLGEDFLGPLGLRAAAIIEGQALRNMSGSFAILAAIRRAWSLLKCLPIGCVF